MDLPKFGYDSKKKKLQVLFCQKVPVVREKVCLSKKTVFWLPQILPILTIFSLNNQPKCYFWIQEGENGDFDGKNLHLVSEPQSPLGCSQVHSPHSLAVRRPGCCHLHPKSGLRASRWFF